MKIANAVYKLVVSMEGVSIAALVFMMIFTTLDVVLKLFKKPIIGAYDVIAFACGIAISFAIPITSWMKAHVMVDLVCERLPKGIRRSWLVTLRVINLAVFLVIGIYLFRLGTDFAKNGELCVTLRFPLAPFAWGMGCACMGQCLVMITDIVRIIRGEDDHE